MLETRGKLMKETKVDQIVTGIFDLIPIIMQSKRLVHNKMMNRIEMSVAKAKLSEPHIRILIILSKHKDITMTGLGKLLMISKPNATPLIDILVELKMVDRISDPKDRRLVNIQLTKKGLEFIQSYKEIMREEAKKGLVRFSEDDMDSYIDILQKMKYFTLKLNDIYDKI
jgi:DNA-binding MarR family transcriptional regulator